MLPSSRPRLRPIPALALSGLLFIFAVACGSADSTPGLSGSDVSTPDTLAGADGEDTPDGNAGKEQVEPEVAVELSPETVEDGGPDTPDTPDTVAETSGGPCDDGDPCTYGDHLVPGDDGGPELCVGTAYACDDGKGCTQDACDGVGGCAYAVIDGNCLIDGSCVAQGASPVGNLCVVCGSSDKTGWTELEDGVCDDGDACTVNDHCLAGVCASDDLDCDDDNICTDDSCDPASGCEYINNHLGCDDDDVCSLGDICVEGSCVSGDQELPCDDDNVCTVDLCLPDTGCQSSPAEGDCDDGNACSLGDSCAQGICMPGATPLGCDDQNECTIDSCDLVSGCQHVLDAENACCATGTNPCDDNNPCTKDVCDTGSEACAYENLAGSCDDLDACTTGDACVDGACIGAAISCDDGNTCTTDSCDVSEGCGHVTLADGELCDDGSECTGDDICQAGVCLGDTMGCTLCPPEFWNPANIVVELTIGNTGDPGNGLDIDEDPSTCAPPGKCSEGIDNQFANALATLAAFINVNDEIAGAIADGSISLLFEHVDPLFNGNEYVMDLYIADPADWTCVPMMEVCDYEVDLGSLTETCTALIQFPNARIDAGHLTAGGPDATFVLSMPLLEGVVLDLTLYMARIEADVVLDGGDIAGLDKGIIGGAVRQQQILDLVDVLPESLFEGVPGGKGLVVNLIPTLFKTDVDTDGDGVKDATSIGIKTTATAATIVGLSF